MLEHERYAWASGYQLVAGVDEAGRGPLAGPVIAAAVVVPAALCEQLLDGPWARLTDSKALSEKIRIAFYDSIQQTDGVSVGVGRCEPSEIDELNILRATHVAMARAVQGLPETPDFVLVDGLPVKGLPVGHKAIVRGDASSLLIAAASIVAKVTRDKEMEELDKQYPDYAFARHKGYGTPEHLAALRACGPCPIHRRSFAPVRQLNLGL